VPSSPSTPSPRTTRLAADVLRFSSEFANAELFERIVGRIHSYFRKVVRDEVEAEDCLQETLTILVQSLKEGKYDPTRSFNTWIWVKARSVYAQWCRKRERRMATLTQDVAEKRDASDGVDRRLDAQAVLDALADQIGPESYEAFVLHYEGGLTRGEIAEVLGRDPKTINKRLEKAHEAVTRLMRGS